MRTNTRVAQIEVEGEVLERALRDYERELISLGRLAELLDTDPQTALEFLLSRGIEPRFGPQTHEEVLRELATLRNLSKKSTHADNPSV